MNVILSILSIFAIVLALSLLMALTVGSVLTPSVNTNDTDNNIEKDKR